MIKKKFIFIFLALGFLFNTTVQAQGIILPDNTSMNEQTQYTPGAKWGGISLENVDSEGRIKEKCESESTAEIISTYFLTNKIYIFKTDRGYGVADIDISYRDLETGVRRQAIKTNTSCVINPNVKLFGEIDCKGFKSIKKEPYEGCAYDVNVWAHSLTKEDAFQMVYKLLQGQFVDYKEKCVIPPGAKSIQERMQIF